MRASVIIPTRNRAGVLERCLASLTRQTLPRELFEVIVVDNGSTDRTASVVERYTSRLTLRYIHAPEPGLHVGRHAGYRAARSDTLIFGDDDIEAEPTWVEAIAESFEDERVGLVTGNNLPNFEFEPPDWLGLLWVRPVYRGRAIGYLSVMDFGSGRFPIDPHYIWGCNFSVRRQALEAVGGFHPDSLPPELLKLRGDGETHVAQSLARQGWAAIFDSRASVRHLVSADRMTQQYFEKRAYAQGISDSYVAARQNGGAPPSVAQRLTRCVRSIVATMRCHVRACRADDRAAARKLLHIELASLRAWEAGYRFHQNAIRTDADLRAWVLKSDYL